MSDLGQLSEWTAEVSQRFRHLSKAQAGVLALYSFGMVLVQASGITRIAVFLAGLLGQKEGTLRQRLRELYFEAEHKRGEQRRELEVRSCFGALLSWVVAVWSEEDKQMALGLDATTLGQRFTVLSLSVLYRGGAIPVAWAVLPASQAGAWRPHWLGLLAAVQGVIPADWTVLVLSDRGLYARWLFKAIQAQGWHPFMRINSGGSFRPLTETTFRPLSALLKQPGEAWAAPVDCFKTAPARLRCTLLAQWQAPYAEPWLILTDLAPDACTATGYALRAWIEQGFKDCKRGGFHGEHTKMTHPARAERLWLIMAWATLWALLVGGTADALLSPTLGSVLALNPPSRRRRLSCFRRGLLLILLALIQHAPLPLGRFFPEPWPSFSNTYP